MSGTVYLVGAGPGDPGLITRRALDLIAEADVILYDRLIPAGALDNARPDADLRYVGKRPGEPAVGQDEISRTLIELARAGRSVVRLKGGDPFVFGRGGEEAQALAGAGVPFEVVPGVTAGVAAPAYAGIPVTHRDAASAVAFVTGHEDPSKPESALDWPALAAFPGTLVLYMGVRNLERIASSLVEAGRPADEPAAVIARGTLASQRTVTGTLSDIASRAAAEGLEAPAVTVVGPVAALHERLRWLERRPLVGLSVVVRGPRAGDPRRATGERGARPRRRGDRAVRARLCHEPQRSAAPCAGDHAPRPRRAGARRCDRRGDRARDRRGARPLRDRGRRDPGAIRGRGARRGARRRAGRRARPLIVTLLTDYGYGDEFVGVCHGVIRRIAPEATILDVTHGVPRHDVRAGALALRNALPYLPVGVHVAIVDPQVGTERRSVALRCADGRILVGPDNGLLSLAWEPAGGVVEAADVSRSPHRLEPVSATFHGRDVFAAVAAHLAAGAPLAGAGDPIDSGELATLPFPVAKVEGARATAHALVVDRFGNVALNLEHADLLKIGLTIGSPVEVVVGGGSREAT